MARRSCRTLDTMSPCPHCNQGGFTQVSKWAARDLSPGACSICGELAFIPAYRRSGILVASIVLLTVIGLASVAARSYLIATLGVFGVTSFYVWRMRAAPLERTWRAHKVVGAKVGFVASASAVLLSIFQ